jgi:type IV pilus biogenesis protein CpaD/CtpE
LKRMILTALALAVLAGCATTDTNQVASHEQTYTPLGSYLPRKTVKDERTYIDKEEFKRQQEMAPTPGIVPKG